MHIYTYTYTYKYTYTYPCICICTRHQGQRRLRLHLRHRLKTVESSQGAARAEKRHCRETRTAENRFGGAPKWSQLTARGSKQAPRRPTNPSPTLFLANCRATGKQHKEQRTNNRKNECLGPAKTSKPAQTSLKNTLRRIEPKKTPKRPALEGAESPPTRGYGPADLGTSP